MLRLASQSRICGGGTVGAWFGGPPLGGFRGEPHKLETPNVTPCNANASYADAPSCVFGACAWQFLIFVFSLKSPFRFSDSELAIQPSNPQHCNSVSFVRRNDRVASLGHVLWLMSNHDHALPDERNPTRLITFSVLHRVLP